MGNMTSYDDTNGSKATHGSRTRQNTESNRHYIHTCNSGSNKQQTQTFMDCKDIDAQIDVNMVCDTQILLDTIEDIWKTIGKHIEYANNKPGSWIPFGSSKQDHQMKLLYKVDSLMIILKMFGISCQRYKNLKQFHALEVGKHKVAQLFHKLSDSDKKIYEPYAQVLNHLLKGDKMHFKKRIKPDNEAKVKISQRDMFTIISQLVGGQHETNANMDGYKDRKVAFKLNEEHNILKKQYRQGHAKPNDVSKLYEVVGITGVKFV